MPLKKDPQHGGTNSDGTLSTMYCSLCYKDGAFTRPGINAKEMQGIVVDKMKSIGFPGFVAKFFASNIPKLERWKEN